MAPIAGWYDDPRDESRLRYWDGDVWTEHVLAKAETATRLPTAPILTTPTPTIPTQTTPTPTTATTRNGETATAGGTEAGSTTQTPPTIPQQTPPAAPQWHYPGGRPAQQRVWQYGGPQQPVYPQPQQEQIPQQIPRQIPQQQQLQQPPSLVGTGPWTPDGERITSWGKRCAARVLDLLIVAVGSLPFTVYFLYQTVQAIEDQRSTPGASMWIPDATVLKWEASLIAMFLVAAGLYEIFCLNHFDATIGKRLLEIKVRLFDHPGRLPWSTVAKRVVFIYGLLFLNLVPVLSLPALILLLVNFLWPLRDPRRQALHDKVARTVVVEAPKRAATSPYL